MGQRRQRRKQKEQKIKKKNNIFHDNVMERLINRTTGMKIV